MKTTRTPRPGFDRTLWAGWLGLLILGSAEVWAVQQLVRDWQDSVAPYVRHQPPTWPSLPPGCLPGSPALWTARRLHS